MKGLSRATEMLGVHELLIQHRFDDATVSIRIGNTWMAAKIDFKTLIDVKNVPVEIGRIVYDLADNLKRKLSIAEARGGELDRLATLMGIKRTPEERRPLSRFEAVAEELKKL